MSKVVVYGGGVAGLMAASELAERGLEVNLVAPLPPWRWPMLPEAGIALGDDPERHFLDTMACGDRLAPAAAVRALTEGARALVEELERWGVPFARETDGVFTLRRLPGTAEPSAVFVECRTAELCVRALTNRALRLGVRMHEPFELAAVAREDNGRAIGIVTRDLVTQKMRRFSADAVVLATGGPERIFGGTLACEDALSIAVEAGAEAANVDCIQLHPAALRSATRLCLLSSAIRSETGRFWVPRDRQEVRAPNEVPRSERDFFVDPLACDDECARAIARISVDEGRGVYDAKDRVHRETVYLDVTHLPEPHCSDRLESELRACQVVTGVDARRVPIEVAPAASGCLGGLWVDHRLEDAESSRNHRTSVEGLYAVGDCASLYHGRCRLGGNGLLAALFGAQVGARAVACSLDEVTSPERKIPKSMVRDAKQRRRAEPRMEEGAAIEAALGLRRDHLEESQETLFARLFFACRAERARHPEPRTVRARLLADGDLAVSSEPVEPSA